MSAYGIVDFIVFTLFIKWPRQQLPGFKIFKLSFIFPFFPQKRSNYLQSSSKSFNKLFSYRKDGDTNRTPFQSVGNTSNEAEEAQLYFHAKCDDGLWDDSGVLLFGPWWCHLRHYY